MELNIAPYAGVGLLKFGMIPHSVHSILGEPNNSVKNRRNELVERYDKLVVVYAKSTIRITELGFARDAKTLSYKGNRLFDMDPHAALRLLVNDDRHPMTYLGFIAFFNLGITTTGFLDEDEDDKTVTVFDRGHLDEKKSRFKRIVLP